MPLLPCCCLLCLSCPLANFNRHACCLLPSWALLSHTLSLSEVLATSDPCLCLLSRSLSATFEPMCALFTSFSNSPFSRSQPFCLQIPAFVFSLSLAVGYLWVTMHAVHYFLELSLLVFSAFLTLWLQLHCTVYSPVTWCPSLIIPWGATSVLICFVFTPKTCIIISKANAQILCSVCNSVTFALSMHNMLKPDTRTHSRTNFRWTIRCHTRPQ